MLNEIQGKDVQITLSESGQVIVIGKVLTISDSWLKIQTKKTTDFVRIEEIIKISII